METTCYLQVEPQWAYWDSERLAGIKVRRVTAKKPESPLPGVVVVKLKLDIDDQAFMPLKPEVTVKIPVDRTEAIEVESEPLEVPA